MVVRGVEISYTRIAAPSLSPDSRWVWRSGARSVTKAGASTPREVRSTSGATDDDVLCWFAPMNFSVCRALSIRFPSHFDFSISGIIRVQAHHAGIALGSGKFSTTRPQVLDQRLLC